MKSALAVITLALTARRKDERDSGNDTVLFIVCLSLVGIGMMLIFAICRGWL